MPVKIYLAVGSWGLTAVMMSPHIGSLLVMGANALLLVGMCLPTGFLKRAKA